MYYDNFNKYIKTDILLYKVILKTSKTKKFIIIYILEYSKYYVILKKALFERHLLTFPIFSLN